MATQRTTMHQRREAAEPERPAPRATPSVALLTQLQRSAGNAAVTRMIARFEAGEHTQMAGSHTAAIGTPSEPGGDRLEVSEGDLIALGDFYATAEEMMSAPVAQLQALIELIHRDEDFRLGKGGSPPTTAEWTAAKPDYEQLLVDNAAHFAPGEGAGMVPGGDHRSMFQMYHHQALEKAHAAAAAGSATVPDEAIALNAFACHYLTDAFAAGHLFNKAEMLERVQAEWARLPTLGSFLGENAFSIGVARNLLSDPTAASELAIRQIKIGTWQDIDQTVLSMFVFKISELRDMRELFFNGLLNLVHNRLNRSARDDPKTAIEVTTAKGQVWTLAGDGILGAKTGSDAGEETLAVARAAVAESYRNLDAAAKDPSRMRDDFVTQSVWDYTPKPTEIGEAHFQALITSAVDFDSRRTIDEFSKTTVDELASAMARAKAMGYMRVRPGTPTGPPAGAPWETVPTL
jgi:hypothetical protein